MEGCAHRGGPPARCALSGLQVLGAGASWHKLCFTCKQCNKSVESTTLNEHAGEIYCKGCYSKNFGPKVRPQPAAGAPPATGANRRRHRACCRASVAQGFGYGVGAGALAHAQ